MKVKFYVMMILLAASTTALAQQKTARDYLRSGNKSYRDSLFTKAEVDYRKALEIDPQNTDAMYNLGNTLVMQQKAEDAMKMYEGAARVEKDKQKLAQIYHNMGVVLQSSKQLPQCIEAYKQSLRNNPTDHETRYNLALAMKQQQEQQQQNQDQQQEQKQEQKQDEKQDEQKDQQQQNQQQQQQQQQSKDEMSKENAEQLLKAVMQDEKDVQEKVKKQLQIQGKKLEKDW